MNYPDVGCSCDHWCHHRKAVWHNRRGTNKHYLLARLGHVNDLAVRLEVTSRKLINEILDEIEADVVDSEDA